MRCNVAVELKTMEIKKREQITESSKPVRDLPLADRPVKNHRIRDFLADVKTELSKISWTSPEELKTYTKIVIGTTFCFGMGVYITDLTIQFLLGTLESVIRMIGG